MRTVIRGALGGTLATVPMTAVMLYLFRRLPPSQQYPLPPIEITHEVARRANADTVVGGSPLAITALILHFAYGAVTGVLYEALRRKSIARGPMGGALYGVGVWAASYLGWVPAFRILAPATRHPRARNALMIAAHVAWGVSLNLVNRRLARRRVT